MNRKSIGMLIVTLSLANAGTGGVLAADMATPSGKIITGDTTGLLVVPVAPQLILSSYIVPEIPAAPVPFSAPLPAGPSRDPIVWGYEASAGVSRILAYDVGPGVTPVADCMPPGTPGISNGRGLAYDPQDGNLWYSAVTFDGSFAGDGFIRKTTPPQTGSCTLVTQIPFGDGPGGTLQDDIGAIDIDGESRHLWVAGYNLRNVNGERRSYLYLVNRNNGSIMRSCWLPWGSGGIGNDTLTYARLDGLPGSGQYLLTDAGEVHTLPDSLAVIDVNDCKGGARVTPVASYPKVVGMSGIDFEWPGLLATDNAELFNLGGPPFSSASSYGMWGNTSDMEDITVCAAKAQLGDVQTCPY